MEEKGWIFLSLVILFIMMNNPMFFPAFFELHGYKLQRLIVDIKIFILELLLKRSKRNDD